MLIEIPDPEVILSIITAFVIGMFGLYGYYKLKPFIRIDRQRVEASQLERLEYYERQLIDMKIRLDALDFKVIGENQTEIPEKLGKNIENSLKKQEVKEFREKREEEKLGSVNQPTTTHKAPNMAYSNLADHVLGLITNKPMTSRDIQITLGRTREHTSRLMKKLFQEGYLKRNSTAKPYTYSITEKGLEKLGALKINPKIVV